MPKLENWSVSKQIDDAGATLRLDGNIFGDLRFVSGTAVTTSRVISIDLDAGLAETKNTVYQLGAISLRYQQWLEDNDIDLEDYIKI